MGSAFTTAAPRLIGRYLVFGEIASGGMATVHYGRLTGAVGFARTVAVKRLHPQFAKDPEFVTMFLDEARVAGRIRHPNVVPTLDVVATEGEIFLAMEYVQGESLSKLLRLARSAGRPPPPAVVATILANVLHGLHAAHEAKDEHGRALGIVHRDVSPQNVMVGADGVARVLDFGVAKAAGRMQTTREGQIKGKLSYMSPEQLNGGGVTRLADVYAAAVVLWETLTQARLFDGENEAITLVRVLEGRVQPPSQLVAGLPVGTDEVVLRGLARDPANRYQTARDMAVAIERTMGLASPAIVGEWVESVAESALAARAAMVARIEQASVAHGSVAQDSQPRSEPGSRRALPAGPPDSAYTAESIARLLPGPPSGPSGAALVRAREEPASQVSSISVSRNAHRVSIPHEPRALPRVAIAVVASVATLAVSAGVFLVATRSHGGASEGTPATAAARGAAAVGEGVAARALTIVDYGSTRTDAPDLAVPRPARPFSPAAKTLGAGAAVTPRAAAAPPSPPRTVNDCNPPYTIDPATGHKKYKKNCD